MSNLLPPALHWTAENMPDQTGRVVIVTGGNSGIGLETCRALLKKNAKVYLAARSPSKAQEAITLLKADTGREAIFLQLDLADLKMVRKAAEEFQSKERELHVLFNNAGVMTPPPDQLTVDGYDLQFGTNALGHFFLTKLLLPSLLAASTTGRVINTTSDGHLLAPASGIDWDTLKGPKSGSYIARYVARWRGYGQSKMANILLTNELGRRYGDKGLVSISVHPGLINTNLSRHQPQSKFLLGIVNRIIHTAEYGAISQLYAGVAPEAASLNGKYLIPWARERTPRADARDHELGQRFWDWCEEQVKGF